MCRFKVVKISLTDKNESLIYNICKCGFFHGDYSCILIQLTDIHIGVAALLIY